MGTNGALTTDADHCQAPAGTHKRLYRTKRLMGFEPTTFCMASLSSRALWRLVPGFAKRHRG
jgi:hypothetical protein